MRAAQTLFIAMALVLAPLGAKAADLVVWWDEGLTHRKMKRSGRSSPPSSTTPASRSSSFSMSRRSCRVRSRRRCRLHQPPDFAYGMLISDHTSKWALDDRLVDLTGTIGFFSDQFDPDALAWYVVPMRRPGRRRSMRCRWVARPTTSTSGKVSWSRRASRCRTYPGSGGPSGHSGATKCNRPCVGPPGAMTSGAWASPCRLKPAILTDNFSNSCRPTRRIG